MATWNGQPTWTINTQGGPPVISVSVGTLNFSFTGSSIVKSNGERTNIKPGSVRWNGSPNWRIL